MARDFAPEVAAESAQRDAIYRWILARKEAILENVTVHDVLRKNGIQIRGGDREEQISCPFHGRDRKPSCRVYPAAARSNSHVWCFVCQERWDAISLWAKFSGETKKFSAILAEIERAYGIVPPERPPLEVEDSEDPEMLEAELLFDVCEMRLRGARRAFDMQSYLKLGSVLDRLYHSVSDGSTKPGEAKGTLQKVLDKIGEKVRACPAD